MAVSTSSQIQALLRLAHTLAGGDAVQGASTLIAAAAVAMHGVGCDPDEAIAALRDNLRTCAEHELGSPRVS